MSKRKNYLKLFLDYSIDNDIWFAVCGDGSIDECTSCISGEIFLPNSWIKLGSKAAYEWIKKEYESEVTKIPTGEDGNAKPGVYVGTGKPKPLPTIPLKPPPIMVTFPDKPFDGFPKEQTFGPGGILYHIAEPRTKVEPEQEKSK